MKKKVLSLMLAAAMTVTMLAGCGSSKQEEQKKTEKSDSGAVVLNMYHSWSTDSERGAALDKLIQDCLLYTSGSFWRRCARFWNRAILNG